MDLYSETYEIVKQIPSGKVSTYGAVAKALGDVRASRAVGRMMNQNPDPDSMPCFKIVYSDGRLGGFGLGIEDKIRRLVEDGICVTDGRIINFEDVYFEDFQTTYPLKKLRNQQQSLQSQVDLIDHFDTIETIAGFDVAYPKNDFDNCCCACVVYDYNSMEIIEKITHFSQVHIPYIPTYLAFRESPLIQQTLKKLHIKPTVLMIDGNGILHPYSFGIACHIGVDTGFPCIGVAKSLLCGSIYNDDVIYEGEKKGFIFYANNRIKNPVYISPGHNISFETSKKIVKHLSNHKIPEPLRQAHLFATKTIRNE
jgi:deoxyribonuclease V